MKALVFDATFGEPWVRRLETFFKNHREPRPQLIHVHEKSLRGADDESVVNSIADIDCVMVTGDQGRRRMRRGRPVPRMPRVCQKRGIPCVCLSGSMHNNTQFQKARAIVYLWPAISKILDGYGGSKYAIQCASSSDHFKLVQMRQDNDMA